MSPMQSSDSPIGSAGNPYQDNPTLRAKKLTVPSPKPARSAASTSFRYNKPAPTRHGKR